MKPTLRVMMVSGTFLPTVGGAEVATCRLAGRLIERGLEVSMVTPQRDPSWAEAETLDNGLEVWRLKQSGTPKTGTAAYLWRLARFLRARKNSYDMVHACFLDPSTLVAARLRNATGRPTLCRLSGGQHTGDVARIESKPLKRLWWKTFRRMDAFVVMSRHLKEELKSVSIPERRIHIIPNGVDRNLFSPADAKQRELCRDNVGIGPGTKTILYVGRLSEEKGVKDLVQAFHRIAGENEEVRLCLVGDGPEKEFLKKMCKTLGLGSKVHFAGKTDRVREYLRACDLFVLPSLAEGMPNALLEAMACGLPCVATDIGGTIDVIKSRENGLLAAPGNPSSLAEAMQLLLGDRVLADRVAESGRRTIEEHFSLESTASAYINLYESLFQKGA